MIELAGLQQSVACHRLAQGGAAAEVDQLCPALPACRHPLCWVIQ